MRTEQEIKDVIIEVQKCQIKSNISILNAYDNGWIDALKWVLTSTTDTNQPGRE